MLINLNWFDPTVTLCYQTPDLLIALSKFPPNKIITFLLKIDFPTEDQATLEKSYQIADKIIAQQNKLQYPLKEINHCEWQLRAKDKQYALHSLGLLSGTFTGIENSQKCQTKTKKIIVFGPKGKTKSIAVGARSLPAQQVVWRKWRKNVLVQRVWRAGQKEISKNFKNPTQ